MDDLRIGQGYDIHPLAPQRRCVLGGVVIPTADGRGTLGHSDGDPLLHAVIDAILGSAALGDIGKWYPDSDPKWKDADSRQLLASLMEAPQLKGWCLGNLDCTVIAATPKLSPHILAIRDSLSQLLKAPVERISVKAKSDNGMSPAGQGEAIAAYVSLLAYITTP